MMNKTVTLMTSTRGNDINWGPDHKIKYTHLPCSLLNQPETLYAITVLGKQVQFFGPASFPSDSDSVTEL